MITLEKFVKETLQQISNAVNDVENGDGTVQVRPKTEEVFRKQWSEHGLIYLGFDDDRAKFSSVVDFDVAITAEESGEAGGGASVKVLGMISVDGKAGLTTGTSSVSRVRFKLPLTI